MRNTETVYNDLYREICTINSKLDYSDLIELFIELCESINSEKETDWAIGEYNEADLAAIVIGGFWHFTEWHNGQYSRSYLVLSQLGAIYSPGIGTIEQDTSEYFVYSELESIATNYNKGAN